MFGLTYFVLSFALVDIGSIYNVNQTIAFSIVKVQMSNDENKHGQLGSCWHCKLASKFASRGDLGYRHCIPRLLCVRCMFFLVQFPECYI